METQILNSLEIKNFRSLEDFTISQLGRVNLIVGKNNSGKSSVLEALQIYAGNANYKLLTEIAKSHDEKYLMERVGRRDPDEELEKIDSTPPFQDFFSGRKFPEDEDKHITIGEINNLDTSIIIKPIFIVEKESSIVNEDGEKDIQIRRIPLTSSMINDASVIISEGLLIEQYNKTSLIDFNRSRSNMMNARFLKNILPCSTVPTRYISIDELAGLWDKIALTEADETIKQALKIILPEFENLIFVNSLRTYREDNQRSAKVKITGLPHPVPLKSLGDGMLRVLQLILKIFPAQGGILLIDEFENGLHYSVQEEVWNLLFTLAKQLDVQIFATTHSWDCVSSFAKVATEQQEIEGVALRIGKSVRKNDKGRVISTVFNEEELQNIMQMDMDIR